jgi:Zn-dependent M16 (insulinase) family peptidase
LPELTLIGNFQNPESLKLSQRPFTGDIRPLTCNTTDTVYYPSDSEASSNGLVAVAWRGPHITDLRHLIAMDLLFAYLTDSTISPLQAHFVNAHSLCSKVTYQVQEYRQSHLMLTFINTQLECLDSIKSGLDTILQRVVHEEKDRFDSARMQALIKMKVAQINDKFEDEPHQTASRVCIGDFLYGSLENEAEFRERFSQAGIFEELRSEPAEFWLALADKWLIKAFSVVVVARPCEKLAKALGDEDRLRVEERKKSLGKKKLKELKRIVENAIEENDVSFFRDVNMFIFFIHS